MIINDITVVNLDDWVGIYIDGKCAYQNHSIRPNTLLNLLGITSDEYWIEDYNPDLGGLPENLSELNL